MKQLTKKAKLGYIILSLFISGIFCFGISRDNNKPNLLGTHTASSDTYVLEDIKIEYLYDSENYEVQSFVNEPYAVIRGNASTLNRLKLTKKKPTFYIDLRGKKPGNYQSKIAYKGVDIEDVSVSIYPVVVELKLQEKQTVSYTPVFEYQNMRDFDVEHYTLSTPTLSDAASVIKIRDTQDVIGRIGKVAIYLDVENLTQTTTKKYKVHIFDTQGKRMNDVNILTPEVDVTLPIESKIVNQSIIKEVVDTEKTKKLEKELSKLKADLREQTKELEESKKNTKSDETSSEELQKRENAIADLAKKLSEKQKEQADVLVELKRKEKENNQKEAATLKHEKALEKKEAELSKKEETLNDTEKSMEKDNTQTPKENDE